MNDNRGNPARLKDRHDQPDLVERIAGQAARDLPEPPPLSPGALARIAMRIEDRNSKLRALRLGPVLVAASVLLGVVTVASAARMDLLPRWIAKMVGMEGKPVPSEPAPQPRKARPPAKKTEVPLSAPPVESTPAPQDIVQPETAPARDEAPKVEATKPTADGVAPHGKLALAVATEERGDLGRARTSDGNNSSRRALRAGQPTPPAAARVGAAAREHGHANGNDDDPGIAWEMKGARLAMKPPVGHTEGAPIAPAATAAVLPSAPPSPAVTDRSAPVVAPPGPAERPAPPSPAATAPTPPPPAPAPAAMAPERNPAARHLKDVVHALRVQHSPRTALDLLDRHAQELAGNAFAEEALLLRVEAMLALQQQPEALRLLDGTSLANAASSSVLLVTRGQLRANAHRCAEAVADFDLALARALRPSKQALQGRAQCKKELGDAKGAQADLDRLHREFP